MEIEFCESELPDLGGDLSTDLTLDDFPSFPPSSPSEPVFLMDSIIEPTLTQTSEVYFGSDFLPTPYRVLGKSTICEQQQYNFCTAFVESTCLRLPEEGVIDGYRQLGHVSEYRRQMCTDPPSSVNPSISFYNHVSVRGRLSPLATSGWLHGILDVPTSHLIQLTSNEAGLQPVVAPFWFFYLIRYWFIMNEYVFYRESSNSKSPEEIFVLDKKECHLVDPHLPTRFAAAVYNGALVIEEDEDIERHLQLCHCQAAKRFSMVQFITYIQTLASCDVSVLPTDELIHKNLLYITKATSSLVDRHGDSIRTFYTRGFTLLPMDIKYLPTEKRFVRVKNHLHAQMTEYKDPSLGRMTSFNILAHPYMTTLRPIFDIIPEMRYGSSFLFSGLWTVAAFATDSERRKFRSHSKDFLVDPVTLSRIPEKDQVIPGPGLYSDTTYVMETTGADIEFKTTYETTGFLFHPRNIPFRVILHRTDDPFLYTNSAVKTPFVVPIKVDEPIWEALQHSPFLRQRISTLVHKWNLPATTDDHLPSFIDSLPSDDTFVFGIQEVPVTSFKPVLIQEPWLSEELVTMDVDFVFRYPSLSRRLGHSKAVLVLLTHVYQMFMSQKQQVDATRWMFDHRSTIVIQQLLSIAHVLWSRSMTSLQRYLQGKCKTALGKDGVVSFRRAVRNVDEPIPATRIRTIKKSLESVGCSSDEIDLIFLFVLDPALLLPDTHMHTSKVYTFAPSEQDILHHLRKVNGAQKKRQRCNQDRATPSKLRRIMDPKAQEILEMKNHNTFQFKNASGECGIEQTGSYDHDNLYDCCTNVSIQSIASTARQFLPMKPTQEDHVKEYSHIGKESNETSLVRFMCHTDVMNTRDCFPLVSAVIQEVSVRRRLQKRRATDAGWIRRLLPEEMESPRVLRHRRYWQLPDMNK